LERGGAPKSRWRRAEQVQDSDGPQVRPGDLHSSLQFVPRQQALHHQERDRHVEPHVAARNRARGQPGQHRHEHPVQLPRARRHLLPPGERPEGVLDTADPGQPHLEEQRVLGTDAVAVHPVQRGAAERVGAAALGHPGESTHAAVSHHHQILRPKQS
jgi:hypothetical protein